MKKTKELIFLGVYTWGIILENESDFMKNKCRNNAQIKFTGKSSLKFWNAYIVEYLCTKKNSDTLRMFFFFILMELILVD